MALPRGQIWRFIYRYSITGYVLSTGSWWQTDMWYKGVK